MTLVGVAYVPRYTAGLIGKRKEAYPIVQGWQYDFTRNGVTWVTISYGIVRIPLSVVSFRPQNPYGRQTLSAGTRDPARLLSALAGSHDP